MNKVKQLASTFDRGIDFLALLAGAMLVFAILAISAEVIMRYFFHRPLLWVVDVTESLLLYVVFLGAAWLLKTEGHVMVDIVFNKMNPKVQGTLNVATSILGVGACLALAWFAGRATWVSFQQGVVLMGGITYPKYALLAVIPLGSLVLAVQFVKRTYGHLMVWRCTRGEQPSTVKPLQQVRS